MWNQNVKSSYSHLPVEKYTNEFIGHVQKTNSYKNPVNSYNPLSFIV